MKNRVIWTLVPAGVWLTLFMLLPLLIIGFFSLGYRDEPGKFVPGFGLHNYVRFFEGPYLNALWRTFVLATVTTALCLLVGFPVAMWLAFVVPKKRQNLYMILLTVPMSVSFLLRIYAWITILRPTGVIANVLQSFGWQNPPILLYSPGAVLLGMVYNYLPYMILPLYASLEKLDKRLLEAAYDLGASGLETIRRVVLPQSSRGIVAGIVMVWIPCLGDYVTPDLMGGAKNMYIGTLVQNQYLCVQDWAFGSAVSTILLMIVAVGVWIYLRYGERSVTP
ncbi:MAG: ABC transporter permease [Candidatus Obscuribacterales bacterium]|nr:ABC transporter permease [Candidatus Obscuribacterales bacterium]